MSNEQKKKRCVRQIVMALSGMNSIRRGNKMKKEEIIKVLSVELMTRGCH